jgi:hypothetical protein
MKEIIVRPWCDGGHDNAGGRIEAVIERTITVNGSNPRVLDLCATHDRWLMDMVEAGGVAPTATPRVGGRRKIEGPHICPLCQGEHASRNALTKHVRSTHQTSVKELEQGS